MMLRVIKCNNIELLSMDLFYFLICQVDIFLNLEITMYRQALSGGNHKCDAWVKMGNVRLIGTSVIVSSNVLKLSWRKGKS